MLGLHPANERRRNKVTPSLIGWCKPRISPAFCNILSLGDSISPTWCGPGKFIVANTITWTPTNMVSSQWIQMGVYLSDVVDISQQNYPKLSTSSGGSWVKLGYWTLSGHLTVKWNVFPADELPVSSLLSMLIVYCYIWFINEAPKIALIVTYNQNHV